MKNSTIVIYTVALILLTAGLVGMTNRDLVADFWWLANQRWAFFGLCAGLTALSTAIVFAE